MKTQSILFGNGFNRVTPGNPSWDNLLDEIAKSKIEKDIPNTLRYEAIISKQPYCESPSFLSPSGKKTSSDANGRSLHNSRETLEHTLKMDIAQRVSVFDTNNAYELLSQLPVDNYLTTNYDNTLLKATNDNTLDQRYRPEKIYSIRRRYILKTTHGVQTYWPIHGNIDSPASIMLGYDHYCGALSKIESYVKGEYEMPNVGRLSSMINRLNNGIDKVYSWIDLFFISDIHIIGMSLAYEELDLWWILNRRRRIKRKEDGLVNNRIIYYPIDVVSNDKRQLLDGFDVEICDLNDYTVEHMIRYETQLENIKNNLC